MPNNFLQNYPYPSQRRVICGKRGAVATSQPLAAIAGMEMLLAGGNAVDAILAMAIALTVVEPTSNGLGSDAFALVWDGKLHGLNGSGKSPQALNLNNFSGLSQVPELGWLPVTVPGAVSAWVNLWERWGDLPFEHLFAPAIRYATEGFPVSPVTAQLWQNAEKRFLPLRAPEFQAFRDVFFQGDRAPKAGEVWASPYHAKTLKKIAVTGGQSFYQGEIARDIEAFASDTGGYLTVGDLAAHQAQWVEPIATTYRDLTVWEIPPNTQGIAALMALNILEQYDLAEHPRESVETYHRQIEAMKLAFADVNQYVGDPDFMALKPGQLLSKTYAAQRQQLIQDQALASADPGFPDSDTVYLCATAGDLMVSLIQSNFEGFGSGILIPETGIALHNRGSGFTLTANHPNQFAPGKRPFHTIIPGFLTRDSHPIGPFGVMGGQMQPQGHVQMAVNLADYGMNPQAALDAPRWRFLRGDRVLVEPMISPEIRAALSQRGHNIGLTGEIGQFGRGQMILRQDDVFIAGSDPRSDGLAIAY
ncbi:MAG: gamma-glutamyltransferase family protein [Jaaginema sp. PMC 1079.18]|nr:gamma-glutamyltransferase family protein [Jaaginema sp. PMC 1080.18]MEC4851842.1 gamma-glutamyltransferase family protein [Jaaginema sp. PMC 1079.18]MEC4864496.1 gamma-glutamyltransferase family protein [Jaaginema sp. PMC 1078.18]